LGILAVSPGQWFLAAACALVLAGLALAFWMVFLEQRLFRIRRVVLDAESLGLPGLKILQITDTHFHGRDEHILRFLRKLAASEQFDLVFLTGDLIDSAEGVASAAQAAALFHPRLGTLAVLGGHDYARSVGLDAYRHLLSRHGLATMRQVNPADQLEIALTDAGIRVMHDAHTLVEDPESNGQTLAVVGLRDAFQFAPDYDAAWDDVPPGTPVIVIAHSPDVLPEVARRRARLAFFGHTHGGQVRFPLLGALVTRSSLPGRLAAGTFRHNGTVFTINNGLGTSPATPYRLLCRPEVTVLELRRKAPPEQLSPVEDACLGRG